MGKSHTQVLLDELMEKLNFQVFLGCGKKIQTSLVFRNYRSIANPVSNQDQPSIIVVCLCMY